MSNAAAGPGRSRSRLPDPPHPHAIWLTLAETAGYLRLRVSGLYELRRRDASFAALCVQVAGNLRVSRAALEQWVANQTQAQQHWGDAR